VNNQFVAVGTLSVLLLIVFVLYVGAHNDLKNARRREQSYREAATILTKTCEKQTETINQLNSSIESLLADCEAYRGMITVRVTPFHPDPGYIIEPRKPGDVLPGETTEDRA
jgi:hypothetical protein